MSRVLIVNMPFSNLRWPNIGPSLLKAALAREGIGCEIAYFNFEFAERVGWDDYYWMSDHFGFVLGGERLFGKYYFGDALPNDERYFREILLHSDAEFTAEEWHEYQRIERHVALFLEDCQRAVDWPQYAIVGFTSSFQQTMPSICLARWIKQTRPQTKIVFGGAACEGEMGMELLRLFPEVDYVYLGEADLTFPPLVRQILAGGAVAVPPGVAARSLPLWCSRPGCQNAGETPAPQSELRCSGPTTAELAMVPESQRPPLAVMDELPYPDFDDYFARMRRSPLAPLFESQLFFESSRGCWWGQKHQCVFCGLNGSRMTFRSKSPQRVIDELRYLTQRHGVFKASTADNILDHRYFGTLLPMIVDSGLDMGFIFEMKTNLTRQQVDLLLRAGFAGAQLGIETFSTPLLKLIGKGATGMQNLQVLRWFSEAGSEAKWNFLYGFPGEDPAEYKVLAELLPSLYHLEPPLGSGRVRVDRFAPYFQNPAAYGVTGLRPNRAFHYVYPFPEESLARLAYYYEYDYADGRNLADYVTPVVECIHTWESLRGNVTLRYWDRSDGVLILTDTRPCAAVFQQRLTGLARKIYLYCDTGRSLAKIVEFAAQSADGPAPDEAAVRRILDPLVKDRLMVFLDGRYLSLALRSRSEEM